MSDATSTVHRDDAMPAGAADRGGALGAVITRAVGPLVVTGVFLVALLHFLSFVPDSVFHRDEARWVNRAVYLRELADPLGPFWDEATWQQRGGTFDEVNRLRNQPPLGSYLMGIGLLAQGRDLDVNGFWNMDQDNPWNISRGNMPEPADLTAARRTTAAVAALTVAAVYAIGARLTNPLGGLAGAAFLAFHPLMERMATFAGSDTVLVLCFALAAVAAMRFADRPTVLRAVLLGVALGLGTAAKLSPLAVAAGLGVVGAIVVLVGLAARWRGVGPDNGRTPCGVRGPTEFRRRCGVLLTSVPVVAATTFVASYPWLWRDPIENGRDLFGFRSTGMALQGSLWPGISVDSPQEALERVRWRLGEEFSLLGGWLPGDVELAVGVMGLVLLAVLALRRGVLGAHGLVLAVLGGQAAVVVVGMRADWARYHLPILLVLAVGVGVCAGVVGMALSRVLASKGGEGA